MKRRTALALSMLLMSFWMGQTALAKSGVLSLTTSLLSVTLAALGGGMLSGLFEPETIPDEEMSILASRIVLAMLAVGLIVSLLSLLVS